MNAWIQGHVFLFGIKSKIEQAIEGKTYFQET